MYRMTKNELSTSRLLKVIVWQTYRHTDRQTFRNYYRGASRMVITVIWKTQLHCVVCWCSMVGLCRVESRWTRRSDVAHEAAARRTDSQQGRTDAAAQQTDARELRSPTSDSRPWSQPWFVQQKQVASPAEAGEYAVETGRRSQSKKSINWTV